MTKILATLKHDLTAKAGQVLILHDNGKIYAVDGDIVELVVRSVPATPAPEPVWTAKVVTPEPAPAPAPEVDIQSARERRNRLAEANALLLQGMTIRMVSHKTGIPRGTLGNYRTNLVRAGLLEGSAKPRKSHFFKSEKTLEAARERGRKLAEAKKVKRDVSA
jgi:hypothetical protein